MDMRGLSVFISDIRKCTTKEQEQKRVEKEMAKIRQKFKNSSSLKGYDRKKYITKLLYMYMLGYDIDFGHMEAINLLSSEKYSEKHMGYLACTLLLNETHELLTLITNSVKNDVVVNKDPNCQSLALTCIANVGGKEFAEALAQDVQKLLVAGETKALVRKKAALCLLRLFRKYPEILPPDTWSERVINLLASKDLGVVTSVMALLVELAKRSAAEYEASIQKVVRLLTKIVINREYTNDYIYYGIPSPWLQIKMLRLLSQYPAPSDPTLMTQISTVLNRVIHGAERLRQMDKNKSVSRNNAVHGVLFEAFNLAIHYDNDRDLLNTAANTLGRFLSDRDTNLRYLSLDAMSRLTRTTNNETLQQIKKHQNTILVSLKDPDISIRRRALDLLYSMCDKTNAAQIVGELLAYLSIADFAIREELVLKIAILAEKFATDLTWYVDVVLSLISTAGDYVADDIWFRVIQIVTNSDEKLQKYAADTVLKAVSLPTAHETTVKVAGYILGEFGYLIADFDETGPLKQFMSLYSKFDICSPPTKALLLNTFIKFFNMYEDEAARKRVVDCFKKHRAFVDVEIQQRANEYWAMAGGTGALDQELIHVVMEAMPNFPEKDRDVRFKQILQNKGEEDGTAKMQHEREVREATVAQPQLQTEQPQLNEKPQQQAPPGQAPLFEFEDMQAAPRPPPAKQAEPSFFDEILAQVAASPPRPAQPPQAAPMASVNPFDALLAGSEPRLLQSTMPAPPSPPIYTTQTQQHPSPSLPPQYISPAPPPPPPPLQPSPQLLPQPQPQPPQPQLLGGMDLAKAAAERAARMNENREATIDSHMARVSEDAIKEDIHRTQQDAAQRLNRLIMQDSGVAMENAQLQLGLKSEFHGEKGRIMLAFGNKQAMPLGQVRATILEQHAELRVQISQLPPIIAPKTQVQQYISCECLDPFDKPIQLGVFFEFERQQYKFTLRLPITLNKFVEPLTTIPSNDEFFARWNSCVSAPNVGIECVSIFKSVHPIDMAKIKAMFSGGFRLSIVPADTNPANLVAAGTLCTSRSGKFLVLVRLQTNPQAQAFKLTVRSPNQMVANQIGEIIKHQLKHKVNFVFDVM